jgi:hypothetical protein
VKAPSKVRACIRTIANVILVFIGVVLFGVVVVTLLRGGW